MSLSFIQKKFLREANKKRRRLAIGIWRPDDREIIDSLYLAQGYADLTVVGSQIEGLNCIPTKDDDEASQVIVDLVKEGKVEGFVRAQLKDSFTHKVFLEKMGRKEEGDKAVPSILAKEDVWFVVANCSNYQSLTADQQKKEALRTAQYFQEELGIEPTIAVMSTRRLTGKVGEYPLLEEIAENNIETANFLRGKGYDVKEYYIEYERAVWEKRNLFVIAIGMIGNTWAKGLVYLGGWTWVHTPYLDQGAYYDDTPRNNKDWLWPVISTVAWINRHS